MGKPQADRTVREVPMRPNTPDLFEGLPRRRPLRKVRVLYVIRRGRGRAARLLWLLLKHLDRERFEPAVAASTLEDPAFSARLRRLGVCVHALDIQPSLSACNDVLGVQHLMAILRAGCFDVIHTCGTRAGLLGRPAARVSGTQVLVHTPHGFPFEYGGSARGRRFHVRLERLLGRLTDAMICTSQTEAATAVRLGLITPERIHTIGDGVDLAELPGRTNNLKVRKALGISPATRLIVMTATLSAPRDPGTLLRAARHVLKVLSHTHFVLIGDGEMLGYCRDLARQLEIDGKVVCTGYRDDAMETARAAAVNVYSARAGGPSLSLLECMGLARPVVTSDIPGCREVITHGKTGVLFPAGDERILAGAILKLTGDRRLRARLGRAARDYVRKVHDPDGWARAVEAVYWKALAGSAKKIV